MSGWQAAEPCHAIWAAAAFRPHVGCGLSWASISGPKGCGAGMTLDEYGAFCRSLPATTYVVQWRWSACSGKVGGKEALEHWLKVQDGDESSRLFFGQSWMWKWLNKPQGSQACGQPHLFRAALKWIHAAPPSRFRRRRRCRPRSGILKAGLLAWSKKSWNSGPEHHGASRNRGPPISSTLLREQQGPSLRWRRDIWVPSVFSCGIPASRWSSRDVAVFNTGSHSSLASRPRWAYGITTALTNRYPLGRGKNAAGPSPWCPPKVSHAAGEGSRLTGWDH